MKGEHNERHNWQNLRNLLWRKRRMDGAEKDEYHSYKKQECEASETRWREEIRGGERERETQDK